MNGYASGNNPPTLWSLELQTRSAQMVSPCCHFIQSRHSCSMQSCLLKQMHNTGWFRSNYSWSLSPSCIATVTLSPSKCKASPSRLWLEASLHDLSQKLGQICCIQINLFSILTVIGQIRSIPRSYDITPTYHQTEKRKHQNRKCCACFVHRVVNNKLYICLPITISVKVSNSGENNVVYKIMLFH